MNAIDRVLDSLFTKHRWSVHMVFWLVVLMFYIVFFGRKSNDLRTTLLFIGLLMPVTICTTYFINYRLVPLFLLKERYGLFGLYFLYTLIGSMFVEMMISFGVFIVVARLNIRSMSPASVDLFFLLTSLLVVVFLGVSIKMLMHWRKSKEDYQKLMRDKVETELKFLKMQLNPHFLFNTLNNLYALANDKSDKTPHAILALSELLDYVLHNTSSAFTSLENEIKQTKNYIALESLRYEDRLRLDFEIKGERVGRSIPPMLLITLTDNAFKHGVMSSIHESWISLTVDCQSKHIFIEMKNSIGPSKKVNGFGIGLENLKNQLMLLYGDKHRFEIEKDEQLFQVNIMLHEI
jgi:two-component system LytT family sensor kinase